MYTTGSELHLNLPTKRSLSASWICLHIGPELHLDVFILQEPVLLLMGLSIDYTEVCAAPGSVNKAGACTASECIWTAGAFAGLDISTRCTIAARAAPGHVYTTEAGDASGRVSKTGS